MSSSTLINIEDAIEQKVPRLKVSNYRTVVALKDECPHCASPLICIHDKKDDGHHFVHLCLNSECLHEHSTRILASATSSLACPYCKREIISMKDFITEVLAETEADEPEFWLRHLREEADPDYWTSLYEGPLSYGSVDRFAFGMEYQICRHGEKLEEFGDQDTREHVLSDGHGFLRLIHEKAVKYGVRINLKNVDTALTLEEWLKSSKKDS